MWIDRLDRLQLTHAPRIDMIEAILALSGGLKGGPRRIIRSYYLLEFTYLFIMSNLESR